MNSKTTEMTESSAASPTSAPTITEHEREAVLRANATGLQPVVFVHGLWLLPSSWDRWATLFEKETGDYRALLRWTARTDARRTWAGLGNRRH